jgi:sortase A
MGFVGRVLIGFGVLVLLFTAYLLWGTGLFEASHQHSLRQQFEKELSNLKTGANSTSTTLGSSASTAVPTSGVQAVVPGAVPPEGQPIGILDIPKLGLDKVVVEGTGTGDLRLGPGHYQGTPLPGQPGNAAIAGHRTTYGAPFYDLNELSSGDPIYVTTTQGKFLYRVTGSQVVSPNDTAVVAATSTPELTLTTCTPRFSAAQRLVVHAQLDTIPVSVPSHSAPAPKHRSGASGLAGDQGSWGGAVGWGLAFFALGVVVLLIARRWRRPWVTYSVGVLPLLVVLFFFFQSVSPLLPASF